MRKPRRTVSPAGLHPSPDPEELRAALGDVSYNLTHDLSDTPQDLRDAAAFAPLAAVKLAQRLALAIRRRPRHALLVAAGLGAVALGVAALFQRRRF